jgi:PAS domain S-box-containing protein
VGTLAGLLGDPARVRTLQYRFRRADGEWIWIESTFTNQVGVAGVDAIVINFRNIHDRRMAEEALRDREMLLREMGRVARVGGWEFDVRTGAGRWTEEVARIHEVDPDAATTRELGISFYRGESRARIEAALERAVREGEPYDLELELTTARGAVRWVRTLGQPVWEEGRVVKLRGAIQDVTASKRAELALAAEATRRRILIEGSRDGIVVLDREGGGVRGQSAVRRDAGLHGRGSPPTARLGLGPGLAPRAGAGRHPGPGSGGGPGSKAATGGRTVRSSTSSCPTAWPSWAGSGWFFPSATT